jgi:multiple sugar transport system ATP-binding protein
VGGRIAIGIRPEHVHPRGDGPRIGGRVLLVEALGAESLAHVEVHAASLDRPELVDMPASTAPLLGERTTTILARLEHDTRIKPGDVIDLVLEAPKLHFFDLDTGVAIPASETRVAAAVAG